MPLVIKYLIPWEFSPTVLLLCAIALISYARGQVRLKLRGEATGFWPQFAFYSGIALIYVALQTYFDYVSQHMFWVHRLQHLILHHVGPFLLVLAAPVRVMAEGMPPLLRDGIVGPLWRHPLVQGLYRLLQQPLIAPLLFVGLIYFWLVPAIHFTAMLDVNRYRAMNWGMVVDGLLFWWLMLAPCSAQKPRALGYPPRILILAVVALAQILLGAYITLHKTILFDVYAICGRAWDISAMEDQQFGGLLTWIPPAMMSGVGALLVLRHVLRGDSEEDQIRVSAVSATATPGCNA